MARKHGQLFGLDLYKSVIRSGNLKDGGDGDDGDLFFLGS